MQTRFLFVQPTLHLSNDGSGLHANRGRQSALAFVALRDLQPSRQIDFMAHLIALIVRFLQ